MAGHSHWNNIQRRKGAVDKKRAKVWGKIAKKIMVAAKRGADISMNLSLRYIVDDAKAANMPKDTIQKAIDKGSGASGTDNFEDVTYEAYGPGGVAMILEALTDNRTRTASDLRTIFDRSGGNLATTGSVSFQFSKVGIITVKSDLVSEERLMEVALDGGAQDVLNHGEVIEVHTAPTDFHRIKDVIETAKIAIENAQLTRLSSTSVVLDGDMSAKMNKLLDNLEDNDDVQDVFHNAEMQ